MTAAQQHRLERLAAVLLCPPVAAGVWTLGLRLAGLVLGALWLVLMVLLVVDNIRDQDTVTAAPAAPQRAHQPQIVDPAQALLAELGDDLTGGTR